MDTDAVKVNITYFITLPLNMHNTQMVASYHSFKKAKYMDLIFNDLTW